MCLQLSREYANFVSCHFQSSCLQMIISPLTANIYSPLLGPPFLRNALQILISAVTGRTAAILLRLFHCKNCQKTQTQSVFYSSIWFIQYVATGILCNCKRRTIIGFLSKNYLILHTSHSVELIFDLRCGSEDKRGLLIKNQDGGNWGDNFVIITSPHLYHQQTFHCQNTNIMKIISISITIVMKVMVSEDISTEVQQIEPRCPSFSIN